MRRIILCLVCLLALSGCSLYPAQNAAKANLGNWKLVAPAHAKYIDADTTLDADGKRIRKQTLTEALSLADKMVEKK